MSKLLNIIIEKIITIILIIILSPVVVFSFFLVKLTSEGPFLYRQKRRGLNGKIFEVYKIRTMVNNAEKKKKHYLHLNEARGPVFKIRNDPRYTKMGKILSHMALDEIPQLINVVKGEMSLVGPRPLPVGEAAKIPAKYKQRDSVLPGMTSLWVIKGSHKLDFNTWMELDMHYIRNKSLKYDLLIFVKTINLITKFILVSFIKRINNRTHDEEYS